MNEPQECLDITGRFFEALEMIKSQKRIRGMKTFVDLYGENQRNFWVIRKEGKRIKQEWLTYLVRDFDVSALWLLTGKGKMFTKEIVPREKYPRLPNKTKIDNDTNKA